MSRSKHIKYFRYGWDIIDLREILNFVNKQRKCLKILSYGCNLEYDLMNKLIKKHLASEIETRNEPCMEISFESYDANFENQDLGENFFNVFKVDESRFIQFEMELKQLTGRHIRCHYNIRGHFEVQLDGKQFSTLVYKTLDCLAVYREAIEGQYLFFIDTESEDNEEIRHKMHLLPQNLQSLNLPIYFTEIQKEVYVKDWVRRIMEYIG
ncbi:hypothetical protein [Bacillus sp. FJAT-22090]|uniref:hypothetical protein n=1 Tax=Bacillus sp. FJAT-22090 TaxID=1581038 RepID=UPI0011A7C662|nr:hypothetical protein [Bacillus sp. FJAT-22090]